MPFGQYAGSGASSKWGRSSSKKDATPEDPYDTSSVDKSINNAKNRIVDAGGEVNPDKRNWVEKQLNLPQGQNAFFDVMDVLGRPQQALYGAVDALNKGTNPGKAAWNGAGGYKKIYGSNLVGDLGVKNKYAKAILGTGMDIVADPINLIPGAIIAKAAKAATVPVKATYKGVESALPAVKNFRQLKVEPALQSTKDGLGKTFKYQYKWDETLHGGKSDFLKDSFNQTKINMDNMTETSLRNISANARLAGGVKAGEDVGRTMESTLPTATQRQLPSDPKITQAAKNLAKSNEDVRNWALNNGVQVGELEGYMRHILSQEEKALRKTKGAKNIDRPTGSINNPDKKVLNTRELQGSVEDINQQVGRKLFEPNAFFATAAGQKKLIDYGNAVKFRREVLGNADFAQPYQKGMVIPHNAEVIDTNSYKFLRDPNGVLVDEVGGHYVVTKGVKEALERYQKLTTDEGARGLLKAFDTVQGAWKKLTLLSPGYHIRNIAGGGYNNYIAGMNPVDITKYGAIASKEVFNATRGASSNLYKEYRGQGLASSSLSRVEFSGDNFEKSLSKLIKEQSRTKVGKVATRLNPLRLPETSRELGDVFDQVNRLSLYKWARDKGMSAKQAAAKVRETQFDYTRTTVAEKEILTRMIPFYRWMRNNIPYQLNSMIKNPARYTHFNKLRQNMQESMGIDEKNVPQFMKEQFAIPTSESKFLGLNLPVSDLTKLTDPLKLASDSLTPLVKLPIELSSNFNLFKKKPIEQFDGQTKQYAIPGVGEAQLPIKTAYALEQLGGQVGRGFSQYLQKDGTEDQAQKFTAPSLGINSIVKDYDVVKEKYYQKVKELKKLQDQIDYMEQQTGMRPRTVNEIKKDGKKGHF